MRKLILLAATLGMLLVCTPALAQEAKSADSQYGDPPIFSEGEIIRTHITEIGDYYIRVEDPDGKGITPSESAQVYIGESAAILQKDGTTATFSDLRVGQYIEMTFTGPLEECPADAICTAEIASASKIVILESPADGTDPTVTTPETPGEETPVENPDPEDSGIKVLPDTGGPGSLLPLIGIGALSVFCGILVRRLKA